jgi:biopolymer transport protein ExbD
MSVLRDLADEKHDLEMTPLIDVTFLLLVFFLLTIRFKTLEGKLSAYLPSDAGAAPTQLDPPPRVDIGVRVLVPGERRDPIDTARPWKGHGRYEFVGRVVGYRVGPRESSDPRELEARLAELRRQNPERSVTIDARPGTIYSEVVAALDAARAAGFDDITFAGVRER